MNKFRTVQVINGPETVNKWNNIEYEYNLHSSRLIRKPNVYFPKFIQKQSTEDSFFAKRNYKLK